MSIVSQSTDPKASAVTTTKPTSTVVRVVTGAVAAAVTVFQGPLGIHLSPVGIAVVGGVAVAVIVGETLIEKEWHASNGTAIRDIESLFAKLPALIGEIEHLRHPSASTTEAAPAATPADPAPAEKA